MPEMTLREKKVFDMVKNSQSRDKIAERLSVSKSEASDVLRSLRMKGFVTFSFDDGFEVVE